MRSVPWLILLAALVLAALAGAATGASSHAPVRATGDAALATLAAAEGWPGAGTAASPYVVSDLLITPSGGYGVELADTRAHVVLRGLHVASGGSSSDGLRLVNASNVTVEDSVFEGNRYGIHLRSSFDVTLQRSTVKSSQVGVYLDATTGATLRDNRISVNDHDVRFRLSPRNVLQSNNLSIATGQTGLFFEDNASYENRIDPTNVVNAIPVRWYSGLAGSPSAPVAITGAVVDLKGITNVAQVMVHNSSHVVLDAPTAKAGSGSGIVLHDATGVRVTRATLDGNAAHGILVEGGSGARLDNSTLRGNSVGASLVHTLSATVEDTRIVNHTREGLRATDDSASLVVRGNDVRSNAGRGIVAERTGAIRVEANTLASNGAADILLDRVTGATVRGNALSGAGESGVSIARASGFFDGNDVREKAAGFRLSQTAGSAFVNNRVLLAEGQFGFHFDGEASYDNLIDTTNLVNGTAVRWYVHANGTAVEPRVVQGVSVEARGITNVAQVMVYKSSNLTLEAPVARNGTAVGILVHTSDNVTLDGSSASHNAGHGVSVLGGGAARVRDGRSGENGAAGFSLAQTLRGAVENSVAEGNRGRGILVDASPGAILRGNGVVGNRETGILVTRSQPEQALVSHNIVEGNLGGGILVESSGLGALRLNRIASNGPFGIHLSGVPVGAVIEENNLSGHARGIRFSSTQGATLSANLVTLGAGQHGLWFDEETSYNNSIAPSNLVNGTAVRWYVGLRGTPAQPVVLAGLDSGVPGITNVAQVMIYKSSHVRVESSLAENGTGRGVYALRSDNVSLVDVRAGNNTRHGVHFEASPTSSTNAAVSVRNGGAGILVESSPGARIASSAMERNAGWGLHVLGSGAPGAMVRDSQIRLNQGGLRVDGSNVTSLARLVVEHNGPVGIQLASAVAGFRVEDNRVENQTRAIQFSSSPHGFLERNDITILPGQVGLHFDDEASYNSTIPPTNTVNGVPLRWYNGVYGTQAEPFVVAGIRAEVNGMTNVAQVMLYRVRDVRIEDASVANGSATGIRLHESERVTVNASRIANQTGAGILVHRGADASLQNTTIEEGRADGVLATQSPFLRVGNLTSTGNAGHGLQASSATGVRIRDSTLVGNARSGIHLAGVGVVDLRLNRLEGNRLRGAMVEGSTGVSAVAENVVLGNLLEGLALEGVTHARVVGNDVSANGAAGIRIKSAGAGSRVEDNRVANNPRGIQLASTEFGELARNNLTIAAGQTGLHLDDETSYNNVIATSNVVNGIPVRWYTTLAGTESSLVDLSGIRVELKGITNVAQVMVYKSAYVRLQDVAATNGSATGVLLYRSSNVVLEDSRVSGDAAAVHLQATQSSTLRNLDARGSSLGVRLTTSLNNVVTGIDATGAATGVLVADGDSRSNRIDQVEVSGRAKGVSDPSVNGLRANNLVADAGTEKRVKVGANATFADNLGATRFESERIVSQNWSFGDGSFAQSAQESLLRPVHAYAAPGEYRANYSFRTADGAVLADSVRVVVVPPLSAPRELMAGSADASISLSWIEPSSDGALAIGKYRIHRGHDPANLSFLAEVGPVLAYVDTNGIAKGEAYHYAVSAVNGDGEGPRSNVAMALPATVPGAASELAAQAGAGRVTLTWKPPTDDGGLRITSYQISRASPGNAFVVLSEMGNVTTYTDTAVVNGQPYVYAVRAVNGLGAGPLSQNVTVAPTGAPSAPRVVSATASDSAVSLAWLPPGSDGGSPVLRYRIHRGFAPDALAPVADVGNVLSWTEAGLTNGRTYHYAVTAVNANGEGNRSAVHPLVPDATDTLRPALIQLEPALDSVLADGRLSLYARFVDNQGVDVASVRLLLDGEDVTAGAELTSTSLAYAHPEPLPIGVHTALLSLRDHSGNEANATWTLRVLAPEDIRPILRYANLTLDPATATPGSPVNATVTVVNVGYAPYVGAAMLQGGGAPVASLPLELAPGANATLVLPFVAGAVGEHALSVGEANATLLVVAEPSGEAPGEGEPGAKEPAAGEGEAEADAEAPSVPLRGASRLPVPMPGLAALLAVGAACALASRRK